MTAAAQLTLFPAVSAPEPVAEHKQQAEVMARYERERVLLLEDLRRAARHYCYSGEGYKKYGIPNSVTSDDVRAAMGTVPVSRKDWRHTYKNNIMGCVFRRGFQRVGFYKSKAEGRRGSMIAIWQMTKAQNPVDTRSRNPSECTGAAHGTGGER